MHIANLHIYNFRNISELKLVAHPNYNVLYGTNGSGKTSVLEAIYYLGAARSFRTHLPSRIVRYDCDKFTLFANVVNDNMQTEVGVERSLQGAVKIQLKNEEASVAAVAQFLPMQLLHQNSFELLTAGSKLRRKFIDWGMFHVEHNFLPTWRHAARALEQRNAALKTRYGDDDTLKTWSQELVKWSAELHRWRAQYVDELLPIINELLARLLGDYAIKINYYAGWDITNNLYDILQRSLDRDRALGFTQFGAHRADLRLLINNIPAQDCLSRGQQKIFVFILHLAQGLLLQKLTGKSCVYLIDDLAAELDKERQHMVAMILRDLNAQIFATALAEGSLTHVARDLMDI